MRTCAPLCVALWPLVVAGPPRHQERQLRECDDGGIICCYTTYGGAKNFFNKDLGVCEALRRSTCTDDEAFDVLTNTCVSKWTGGNTATSTTTPLAASSGALGQNDGAVNASGVSGGSSTGTAAPAECPANSHAAPGEPTICECDDGFSMNSMGNCTAAQVTAIQRAAEPDASSNDPDPGSIMSGASDPAKMAMLELMLSQYEILLPLLAIVCGICGCCWLRYCGCWCPCSFLCRSKRTSPPRNNGGSLRASCFVPPSQQQQYPPWPQPYPQAAQLYPQVQQYYPQMAPMPPQQGMPPHYPQMAQPYGQQPPQHAYYQQGGYAEDEHGMFKMAATQDHEVAYQRSAPPAAMPHRGLAPIGRPLVPHPQSVYSDRRDRE